MEASCWYQQGWMYRSGLIRMYSLDPNITTTCRHDTYSQLPQALSALPFTLSLLSHTHTHTPSLSFYPSLSLSPNFLHKMRFSECCLRNVTSSQGNETPLLPGHFSSAFIFRYSDATGHAYICVFGLLVGSPQWPEIRNCFDMQLKHTVRFLFFLRLFLKL